MTDNVQNDSCHGCGAGFRFKPVAIPNPPAPEPTPAPKPLAPFGWLEDGTPVWTLPVYRPLYGRPDPDTGFIPRLDNDTGKPTGGGWARWDGSPTYPHAVATAALSYS